MRLRSIVIDDEPLALGLIESYVKKTPFLELVATFSSAVEALHSGALEGADLIFLDIQMPNLNGLELSKMISPSTRIVFTTAFGEYALDGFRVNALDYLLKPISYSDFMESASRALEWFEKSGVRATEPEHIYVKSDYKLLRIDLSKLLYVEALKDYVKFWVEGESRSILSLMNIKRAMELLPSSQFIRVHRSFVVRKDRIRAVERGSVVIGDRSIPVGDSYKEAFLEYLKGCGA